MPTLATQVQNGEHDPVVGALAMRMLHDKKLAVEVVTGACEWPSPDGEDAEELAIRAADKAGELIDLRDMGCRIPQLHIDELRAAEMALIAIAEDERNEQVLREWGE